MVSLWLAQPPADQRFPTATFAVNVLGCALIGVIAGLVTRQAGSPPWLGPNAKAFLMTGVLGGFTTFSAFGLETFHLLRRGDLLTAGGYVGATVVLGLVAVWLGFRIAQS